MYVSLITLGVLDVERSTRFYEAMGWERSDDSVEGEVAFLRGGATVLGLYGRAALSEDAAGTPLAPPPGSVALATNVSAPEVVASVLAAAERAGGQIVKPAQEVFWGGTSGYFADPDGHLWEVAHNPGWELRDDGTVMLGDDPERDPEPRDPREELRRFRETVDARGGPSSDELAAAASAVVGEAMHRIAALFDGAGNDRIIAAMTLLTERGMAEPPASRSSAVEHAASGLVGGLLAPDGG